jgi:hypothetical protein
VVGGVGEGSLIINRIRYCYEVIQYTDIECFTERDETGVTLKWRSRDDGTVAQYGWAAPRQELIAAGSDGLTATYSNG